MQNLSSEFTFRYPFEPDKQDQGDEEDFIRFDDEDEDEKPLAKEKKEDKNIDILLRHEPPVWVPKDRRYSTNICKM